MYEYYQFSLLQRLHGELALDGSPVFDTTPIIEKQIVKKKLHTLVIDLAS